MSYLSLPVRRTADRVVAMPGPHQFDLNHANEIAAEFGWAVAAAQDARCLARWPRKELSAVLFHRQALGSDCWLEALLLVKAALPEARLIVCHGFAEPIDWPELCEAGAFHRLCLPFAKSELRQCLGFVWQSTSLRPKPNLELARSVTPNFDSSLEAPTYPDTDLRRNSRGDRAIEEPRIQGLGPNRFSSLSDTKSA